MVLLEGHFSAHIPFPEFFQMHTPYTCIHTCKPTPCPRWDMEHSHQPQKVLSTPSWPVPSPAATAQRQPLFRCLAPFRTSYGWNCKVFCPFVSGFFHTSNATEAHPCGGVSTSLFLFITAQSSIRGIIHHWFIHSPIDGLQAVSTFFCLPVLWDQLLTVTLQSSSCAPPSAPFTSNQPHIPWLRKDCPLSRSSTIVYPLREPLIKPCHNPRPGDGDPSSVPWAHFGLCI